jgi:hypothetical protein
VDFVVFKAMFGEGVCIWPFSLLSLQCDLQAPADSGRPKEEDIQFGF